MTAPDPRAWLDAVDARTNAATDGPWKFQVSYVTRRDTYPVTGASWDGEEYDRVVAGVHGSDSRVGQFIAHARTDLPAATAALRAVLDLHADDGYGDCAGCGVDTYENAISWPCSTVTAITTALEDA